MTANFTFHFADGSVLRVHAHEMSVKGDVRVYGLHIDGVQYVLKFTTAFDVEMHRAIIAYERTRDYVVPLVDSLSGRKIDTVTGRAAWSRGPFKLMRRLHVGRLDGDVHRDRRRTAVFALHVAHRLPVPGDWCRAGNTLNDGQREYFFDFDAEEGRLVDVESAGDVDVLGPPAARSVFMQLQMHSRTP